MSPVQTSHVRTVGILLEEHVVTSVAVGHAVTFVCPASRRHSVELWSPKALSISRRRIIEIGSNSRSKRGVGKCSYFVCSQCTVENGNVIHQSAEGVDEERTCLQFCGILANPEVGRGVLHIRTAHAASAD